MPNSSNPSYPALAVPPELRGRQSTPDPESTLAPAGTDAAAANSFRQRGPMLVVEPRFRIMAGLCLVLYIIGGTTGSGWIFLQSACLITLMSAGILLPLLLMSRITTNLSFPPQAQCGDRLEVAVTATSVCRGDATRRPGDAWRRPYERRLEAGAPGLAAGMQVPVMIEFVPAYGQAEPAGTACVLTTSNLNPVKFTIGPLARGVYPPGKVNVSSCYPLGLVWAKYEFKSSAEVTVYPQVIDMEGFFLWRLQAVATGSYGAPGQGIARQSTYTRTLKAYTWGDSLRAVHWASSARLGKLMVREYEAEGLPAFDLKLPLSAEWVDQEQFELAVTAAASLLQLGSKLGIHPELVLDPPLPLLGLNIPPRLPGFETHLEILARVQRLTPNPASARKQALEPAAEDGIKHCPERITIVLAPEGTAGSTGPGQCVIEIASTGTGTSTSGQKREKPGPDATERSHYQGSSSGQTICIASREEIGTL